MRITKNKLRRLIKEELGRVIREQGLENPVEKAAVHDALAQLFPGFTNRNATDVRVRLEMKGMTLSQINEELQGLLADEASVADLGQVWVEFQSQYPDESSQTREIAEELASIIGV